MRAVLVAIWVMIAAINLGPTSAHTAYMPLVANNCTYEAFEIYEYEIGSNGVSLQVQPRNLCSRVRQRIFYTSYLYPEGFWTYWSEVPNPLTGSNIINVPEYQDVGGGVIRHNIKLQIYGYDYEVTSVTGIQ